MANRSVVSPSRLTAFEILRGVENGAYSSILLAAREPELKPADRGLCHELVLGVLRWQLHLDRIIEHYANRRVDKIDPEVRTILRMALYQLRFLSRIPPSAAVNESVKLVGLVKLRSAQPFVNAVLRRATREPEYDPTVGIMDPLESLSVKTSHPVWLLKRWTEAFGFEETARFAEANNQTPRPSMRIVRSRSTEAEVLAQLTAGGATVERSSVAAAAWRISGATGLLRQLAGEGKIYLQDDASQLVAEVVGATAGERVLDLCSAPGGKTALIGERMNDRAKIVACDVSASRLSIVARTVELHQLTNVRLLLLNAEHRLPFQDHPFDRVLVDVPCSGTGTLRGNPEIRWRLSEETIATFAERQKRILENAASVVRIGGRLVYSTCSVEPEEDEDVVKWFLETQPGFGQVPISTASTGSVKRTWPHHEGTDGFFIAAFERTA